MNQAMSSSVTGGNACRDTNGYIGETSYFRAFKLAEYGVHGAFSVTSVSFTVNERVIGTGFTRFPIDISIYDYAGDITDTLDTTKMALRKTSSIDIVATNPEVKPVSYEQPMPADIGTDALVFKVHVQNYTAQMHKFFLAVNQGGESHPGYVACGTNAPKTLTALGFPGLVLLMAVTGESR